MQASSRSRGSTAASTSGRISQRGIVANDISGSSRSSYNDTSLAVATGSAAVAAELSLSAYHGKGKRDRDVETATQRETVGLRAATKRECFHDLLRVPSAAVAAVLPETLPPADGPVTASSSSLHGAAVLPAAAAPGELVVTPDAVFTKSSHDAEETVCVGSSSNLETWPCSNSSSRAASSPSSFSSSSNSSGHRRWLVPAAGGRGLEGEEEDACPLDVHSRVDGGSRRNKEGVSNSSGSDSGYGSAITSVENFHTSSTKRSSYDRSSNRGGCTSSSSNSSISRSCLCDGTGNICKKDSYISDDREAGLPALGEKSDQEPTDQTEMEVSLSHTHSSSARCPPDVEGSTFRSDVSSLQQRPQQTVSSTSRSSRTTDNEHASVTPDDEDRSEDVLLQGSDQRSVSSRESNDSLCFCCGGGGELLCCEGCPKTYHVECLAAAGHLPPRQMDEDWLCPQCLAAAASAATKTGDTRSRCSGDDSSSNDDADFSRSDSSSLDRSNNVGVSNAGTSSPLDVLQEQQLERSQSAGLLLSEEANSRVPFIQCGDSASVADSLNDEASAAVMSGGGTAASGSDIDVEAAAARTDAYQDTEPETAARTKAERDETGAREGRTTAPAGGGDACSTARRRAVREGDKTVSIKYMSAATVEEEGVLVRAYKTAVEQQQQEHMSRHRASEAIPPSSAAEGEDISLAATSSLVEDNHALEQRTGVSRSAATAQSVVDRLDSAIEKYADAISTPRGAAAEADDDGTEEVLAADSSALRETFASSPALSSLSQETLQLQQEDDLLVQLEEQQDQPEREEEPQEREADLQQKAEELEKVPEGDEKDGHAETKQLLEETQQHQDEKPLQSELKQEKDVLQKEQQPHGMVVVPTTKRGEKPTAIVTSLSTAGSPPGQGMKGLDNRLLIPSAAAAELVAPPAAAAVAARIAASGRAASAASPTIGAAPASGGGGLIGNRKGTGTATGVARQMAATNVICGSSTSSSSSASYCVPPSEVKAAFTAAAGAASGKAAVENTLQLATGDTSATAAAGGTCLSGARKRRRRGDEQRINVGPDYQVPHLPQFYLLRTYESERLLLSSPAGYVCSVRAPQECSAVPQSLVGEGFDSSQFNGFPRATAAAASRCPSSVSATSRCSSFSRFSTAFPVSSSPSPLLCDWEFLPTCSSSRSSWSRERDDCLWEDGLRPFCSKQRHTDADLRHPPLEPCLVYSPHCMETRRQLCVALRKNSDSSAKPGDNYHCVNTHQELAKFVEDCAKKWKARPGWQPYSPEFAYKLLHRADYDPQRALSMLDDPGFSFIDMCDPPMRKYENKWKRRDKRGTYPPSPYPPPVVIRAYLQERVRTMRNR